MEIGSQHCTTVPNKTNNSVLKCYLRLRRFIEHVSRVRCLLLSSQCYYYYYYYYISAMLCCAATGGQRLLCAPIE